MILANIIESAFSPLIWVFLQVLLGVHSVIGGSWGWAIIGLTLIVRTLTFPLTRSQFKGMAKMRLHAPELKKIQARYKDDRVRQQEETMKYYKEAGVNPFAACLPLRPAVPGASSRWSTCCARTCRSTSAAQARDGGPRRAASARDELQARSCPTTPGSSSSTTSPRRRPASR